MEHAGKGYRTSRVLIKLLNTTIVLLVILFQSELNAVDSPGFRTLAIQVPDINLKPGIPAYIPVELKTIDTDTPDDDNGLYAMSTVPGLSIVTAYANPTITVPPNAWASIGEAEGFGSGSAPWAGSFNGVAGVRIQKFAIIFDGTAPDKTWGQIVLAVNEGEINPIRRIIGAVNVYVELSPQPTWFTVTATVGSIAGNSLLLKHPYLDGNLNANIFATHVISMPGSGLWNHPISVAYDTTRKRWTITNADGAAMSKGIIFNVRIDPTAVVVRSPNWIPATFTLPAMCIVSPTPIYSIPINHPSANYNPYATVIVTPRSIDTVPVAVRYIAGTWYIVHPDSKTPMPPCGVYNVQVIGFSEYFSFSSLPAVAGWLDPFVSNAAGVSIQGDNTVGPRSLPFWWQLGNSKEPIIATFNLTPPAYFNVIGAADSKFMGLAYTGGARPHWEIVHEDGTPVPRNASINVWGQPQLTP